MLYSFFLENLFHDFFGSYKFPGIKFFMVHIEEINRTVGTLRVDIRVVNSRYFKKKFKTPAHGILNEIKYSFQIPYRNSRASLVCLLPVLFLFLEYRRSLV